MPSCFRSLTGLGALAVSGALAATPRVEIFAGGGTLESGVPANQCRLHEPYSIAFRPDGSAIIAEMVTGNRVLAVTRDGRLDRLAGRGDKGFSGDGGPSLDAAFNGIHNAVVMPSGDLLVADTWNYRVRRIDARTGVISTIAGTGRKGYSGDGGPASKAEFSSVIQIALDPSARHLYVADIENYRVRKIDLSTGVVATVAGNGRKGIPSDGARATDAPLVDPRAVAPAADGASYILERSGNVLRHIDAGGAIRTVAGTGAAGFSGDGGPARDAQLRGPKFISLDTDGSVLIADAENHAIRRYRPDNGRIERVAGTGTKGTRGLGGPPEECELNRPHGVVRGPDGLLYIVDSYNNRVLRIIP